jgi:hypothetical protein
MSRLRGKEAALFPKVIRHVWVCAGQGVTIAFFRTSLSRHNKSGFALDVSGFSHAQKLRCFFLVNVIESIYLPGLTDWGDFQSSVAVSIGIFDKTLLIWKIVQTKVKGHWLRLMRPNSTLTVRLSHAFLLASRRPGHLTASTLTSLQGRAPTTPLRLGSIPPHSLAASQFGGWPG